MPDVTSASARTRPPIRGRGRALRACATSVATAYRSPYLPGRHHMGSDPGSSRLENGARGDASPQKQALGAERMRAIFVMIKCEMGQAYRVAQQAADAIEEMSEM